LTDNDRPKRKRIRLDRELYATVGSVWHVTFDTAGRRPVLANYVVAELVVATLEDRCRKAGANLLLYCVMPDHVHALVVIEHDDLISIVRAVKSILGRWWKSQGNQQDLWQRSFYDRGIRTERDSDEVIGYILKNPVDEGLVADWSDYSLIGGSLLEDTESRY
jgi:putative transposase